MLKHIDTFTTISEQAVVVIPSRNAEHQQQLPLQA
jgi:hypothetical protein